MEHWNYIESLRKGILDLHGCEALHIGSARVHETVQGRTVWRGMVEIFTVKGHPQAKIAYAWSHASGEGNKDEQILAVLGIPPVISARTAVRAAIAAGSTEGK